MSAPTLAERVEALDQAVGLARGHLPEDRVAHVEAVVAKVSGRLGHGTAHTVVALAGPTGAGKSSLYNALTGVDLSDTGVRRPTTSTTHACVWGDDAGPLLDWLGVARRHGVETTDALDGLVLLDLPDHDSTAEAHRVEVDRLVQMVDLLIWISDPQKYADLALHQGYLRPLAGHGDVMRFVLNKVDTLNPTDRAACVLDFGNLVTDDGIADPVVLPVSVTAGTGVEDLRALIAAEVTDKRAAVARLDADLHTAAAQLRTAGDSRGVSRKGRKALVAGLGRAAGVDAAANVVAAQHRRDARRTMAWPPTRLIQRWRRQPIADLPEAGSSPVARAEVRAALRDVGEDAADGIDGAWPAALRRTATEREEPVLTALTAVTDQTARAQGGHPRWWSAVVGLQRVLVLIALAGLLWLLALAVLGGLLKLDTDPLLIDTPGLDWIPLPSLMLLGGAVLGLLVAPLARIPAGIGAKRRAARMRRQLDDQVESVAAVEVLDPLDAVLDQRRELTRLVAVAAG